MILNTVAKLLFRIIPHNTSFGVLSPEQFWVENKESSIKIKLYRRMKHTNLLIQNCLKE
jgi:hypothetical protein